MSFTFMIVDAREAPAGRWLPAVEASLPFPAGARLRFAAGDYEVHGWVAREARASLEPWHDGGEAAACFAGYGLDAGGSLMTARELAAAADAGEARARFHGEWVGVVRRPDGRIWAGSAASGGGRLYATTAGGPTMLSNRARPLWAALRALGRPLSPDWRSLSWLVSVAWVPEIRRTAVAEVELVPASEAVEIEPAAHRVRRRSLEVEELRDLGPGGAPPPDWSGLADRVVGNLGWARREGGTYSVGLTGGKDSRVVAAAIRSAGLLGHSRFYTVGVEGQPDVEVARRVARSLGTESELRPPPAVGDLPAALRRHIELTEGMLTAWDLKGQAPDDRTTEIHGLFGEVYRRTRRADAVDARAFAQARVAGGNDLLGLLDPAWRGEQESRLASWLERLLEQGMPIGLAEEVFYLRVRYPRWASQAQQCDAVHAPPVNALLHPELLAASLRLPPEDRWLERIHYELLAHLAPDLLAVPFAQFTWREGLERRLGSPAPLAREVVTGRGARMGLGWQVPALRRQWWWVRSWVLDRAGELAPLASRERVERHLDLAEIAIAGRPTLRSLRRGVRRPRLLRVARGRPRKVVTTTMALLTVLALLDDLGAAAPPVGGGDA